MKNGWQKGDFFVTSKYFLLIQVLKPNMIVILYLNYFLLHWIIDFEDRTCLSPIISYFVILFSQKVIILPGDIPRQGSDSELTDSDVEEQQGSDSELTDSDVEEQQALGPPDEQVLIWTFFYIISIQFVCSLSSFWPYWFNLPFYPRY